MHGFQREIGLCLAFLGLFSASVWSGADPGERVNLADQRLNQLAKQIDQVKAKPLDAVLLAEEVYYLSHESAQQERIAQLIESLFEASTHGEARAEMGFYLTQLYRQAGAYEKLERLIKSLGYVPSWRVLGPLDPAETFKLRRVLKANSWQGLHRIVSWKPIRAYGDRDFFSEGLGHYGFLNANHAVFPHQLSSALFSATFRTSEKGLFRLGVGFDHRLKAWVDGTLIADVKGDQTPHPDQVSRYFMLKPGVHELTLWVESSSEQSSLGFFARVTDDQHAPVEFLDPHQGRMRHRKVEIVEGAETPLLAAAANRSARALGSMLQVKEFHRHPKYGMAADHLIKSLEVNPDRHVLEKLLALVENPNQRWAYLARFQEQSGESAWLLTQFGQIALSQQRFWEARYYAQQAQNLEPDYWPAQVLMNNTFAHLGLRGQALRNTEQLIKDFPGVPWLLMDLCDLYWQMDFFKETEATLDRILHIRRGMPKYSERKINLLKQQGNTEGLAEFYQSALKDAPYSVGMAMEFADFLVANRRESDAESLLRHLLSQVPENPFLLQALGELRLKMGEDDAMDWLRKSLAIRPQNPELAKMVNRHLESDRPFYQSYRLQRPPDLEPREISPVVVNFDNTVRKVFPDGQSSLYRQLEFEVINEQGVKELQGHGFSYAPLRQRAELISAQVKRGEESILVTQTGRRRISDPEYRTYYDLVSFQVGFPSLQPGDRVQVEYRIDDFETENIYGDYFGDLRFFSSEYPCKRFRYTLLMPHSREITYSVQNMEPEFESFDEGDDRVYQWTLDRVSPYEMEQRMPGLDGFVPMLSVSTFNDWQEMSHWYADLIDNQLVLDRDARARVAELVQGAEDTLDVVKRIYEFVIGHTRYVALEFGIHGYKPYQVNEILGRQFGDCKDKASLLVAMLREAGVPAWVAIVRTSDKGEINPEPPSLSYFNHAIAYVPELDLYLDGTAEYSGIHELPEMDQGALTLLVDEQGQGRLTHIPMGSHNQQITTLTAWIDEEGRATVEGSLTFKGWRAPDLRQYLAIGEKTDLQVQRILSSTVPGLEVQSVERVDRGLDEPVQIRFKGRTNGWLQSTREGLELPLRFVNDSLTQVFTPNSMRHYPLVLGLPREYTVSLHLHMDPWWVPGPLPAGFQRENPYVAADFSFEAINDSELLLTYRFAVKAHEVPVDGYSEMRSVFQDHDRVREGVITLTHQK